MHLPGGRNVLDQYVLVYPGFSLSRGRCHLVVDRESSTVLVGDPRDNPGTSVTNAIEHVAAGIQDALGVDVTKGQLYQYQPWDPLLRRERTFLVEFRGEGLTMPLWGEVPQGEPFVEEGLKLVHALWPYELDQMHAFTVLNGVVRVCIDAVADKTALDMISRIGTIQHISQRRWIYVDVVAPDDAAALKKVRDVAGSVVPARVTTPNAPLDQPGSIPVEW